MMRTKPTNYEAAKALVAVNEEVTVPALVGRLLDAGRREMPTKRELSASIAIAIARKVFPVPAGPTAKTKS